MHQSGIDTKELKLNILVNKNDNRTACAALLKNQLETVGFTVTIDEVSTKEYTRRVKGVEFNLYIGEVKLSDDMSLYPFFDDNSGGVRYGIDNKSLTCDDLYWRIIFQAMLTLANSYLHLMRKCLIFRLYTKKE